MDVDNVLIFTFLIYLYIEVLNIILLSRINLSRSRSFAVFSLGLILYIVGFLKRFNIGRKWKLYCL
jgi:hypothetical protein